MSSQDGVGVTRTHEQHGDGGVVAGSPVSPPSPVSIPRLAIVGHSIRTRLPKLKQDILGASLFGWKELCGASYGDTSG
jgi:hypothetical protein